MLVSNWSLLSQERDKQVQHSSTYNNITNGISVRIANVHERFGASLLPRYLDKCWLKITGIIEEYISLF